MVYFDKVWFVCVFAGDKEGLSHAPQHQLHEGRFQRLLVCPDGGEHLLVQGRGGTMTPGSARSRSKVDQDLYDLTLKLSKTKKDNRRN